MSEPGAICGVCAKTLSVDELDRCACCNSEMCSECLEAHTEAIQKNERFDWEKAFSEIPPLLIPPFLMPSFLIMMVGLPCSGKSTVALRFGHPIVCPDAIRLSLHGEKFIGKMEPYVWAIARTMVEALFKAGHRRVILDATNITRERRDAWVSKQWKRTAVLVDTDVDTCKKRALETNFPVEVIDRMYENFEPVSAKDEGFSIVTSTEEGTTKIINLEEQFGGK